MWLDNRHKLVLTGYKSALYDLQTDPAEETNIAEQHPELTNRLSRELRIWQGSVLNSLREQDYPKN